MGDHTIAQRKRFSISSCVRSKTRGDTLTAEEKKSMRTLAVVTGASRGYGAALALALASGWRGGVDIALVARDARELDAVREQVRVEAEHRSDDDGAVTASVHGMDLGDLDALDRGLDGVFAALDPAEHDRAVLFNNAGNLGDLCPVGSFDGGGDAAAERAARLSTWRSAVDLNVTSSCWLAERFVGELERAGLVGRRVPVAAPSLLVNVSSLAAEQPFPSWGAYCAGKAARDMLLRVVGSERRAEELRVLNWAPGPMRTAMTDSILSSPTVDADILASFRDMAATGTFVDSAQSAARCVEILAAATFESGAHIDFFESDAHCAAEASAEASGGASGEAGGA